MRILLAVDGSEHSYEAVRSLAHLGRAEHVTILHALDVQKPAYPTMVPEVAYKIASEVEKQMREEGARLLDRIASLLPMNIGPVSKQMEVGAPADLIVSVAQQERTDLIVIGARGLGPIKERFLGSVSHRVLTLAPCSKLIVNGHVRAMHQIFLALQGPDDADAAIRFLTTKPFREPAQLTVLTVLPFAPPLWPVGTAVAEAMKTSVLENAREFVEDVAVRLTELGYRARGLAVIGVPAPVILQEAAKSKPDLVLMGSRGRRGLTRFALGSTSHAVLHQAGCSVLVFH